LESLRKEIEDARDGEPEKLNQIKKKYEQQLSELDNVLQKTKREKKKVLENLLKNWIEISEITQEKYKLWKDQKIKQKNKLVNLTKTS